MATMSAPTTSASGAGIRARVVVGVGDPGRDAPVLAWARDEVAATGGRLTLCHAGPLPGGGSTMDALTLADPDLARAVHDVRQRLGGERVDLWLADGTPVDVLAEASSDADLLVLGPPRARRSTAARAAATADRPVVIVRPVPEGRSAPFGGHVVAAVAGRPVDRAVVDFAVRYAAVHHLPVAAVHVSTDTPGDFWFDEDTLETHFRMEPGQLGLLARVVEPVRASYPGVPVRRCVLVGTPVPRLRDVGRGARLTVVGRGHRLLHAVSQELTRTGIGPLAVIPGR